MAHRCYRPLFCRRDRRGFPICSCLLLSVFANFLLLMSSFGRFEQNDNDNSCTETLNRLGVRKVIEYIHRKKESDPVAGYGLINELWKCVNEPNEDDSKRNVSRISTLLRKLSMPLSVKNGTEANEKPTIVPHNQNRERIDEFLARPIINPFEYSYIFNQSSACSDVNLKFIVAVPSAPRNFVHRTEVRKNRAGKFTRDAGNRAKLLFFLGKLPSDRKIQTWIENEQRTHGDIVQSSFIDSTRNLPKKAALLLKWSTTFCDHSTFVFRTDDDIRVNFSKMVDDVENKTMNYSSNPPFILGNLAAGWKPKRHRTSKYCTTFEEYPNATLPDFLLGAAMGYSVATADLLLKAYKRLRPLFLDDVFITGMCAPNVGVAIHDSLGFRFNHNRW